MKSLILGIVLIVIVGIGGLMYRNVLERPIQPVACPMDAKVCPDGTAVARTGLSCTFPACPAPNVSLPDIGVSFALPAGFAAAELPDASSAAAYELAGASSSIVMRRYMAEASSTALATIQKTAIGAASGAPVPVTAYTSFEIGLRRFTVVPIERFEGVVDTAYYLARNADILRFDAIDRNVPNWTDPNLDVSKLPAHEGLIKLLSTIQASGQ